MRPCVINDKVIDPTPLDRYDSFGLSPPQPPSKGTSVFGSRASYVLEADLRVGPQGAYCLLVVQQAASGGVEACRPQHFRRICANFSHSSPPKMRAGRTYLAAVGRTVLCARSAGTGVLMNRLGWMCSLSASGIADGRDGPSQHEAPSDGVVLGCVPDNRR